jgi:hypothetical protein
VRRTCSALLFVAGLDAACAPVGDPAPEAVAVQAEAPPPLPRSDSAFLVGVLGQVGVQHCPAGAQAQWLAVDHVVGWTTITAPTGELTELLGQPVIAIGSVGGSSAVTPPTHPVVECPPMQMRSDWVPTPLGIRMRRGPALDLPHFEAETLKPLTQLSATVAGEAVVVDLRNPVPAELHDVEIRIHYEGCHGKPGTAVRTQDVGELHVGAGTRASFPALVDAERQPGNLEPHRAASVQVLASADRVYFDLDVPLSSLHAGVTCPDR